MTGLLIYLSLVGKSELAADLAIIQAASFAILYSFSGNARSLITNDKSPITPENLLTIRLSLIIPLSITAILMSIYISKITLIFVESSSSSIVASVSPEEAIFIR